jgi:hypothetical protein
MPESTLKEFISGQIAHNPIEALIIRKIVKALADAGKPVVSVWDGEERHLVGNVADVFEQAFNLDEVTLETKESFVFLSMGEGWGCVTDYGLSLEDALKPVNTYIESKW